MNRRASTPESSWKQRYSSDSVSGPPWMMGVNCGDRNGTASPIDGSEGTFSACGLPSLAPLWAHFEIVSICLSLSASEPENSPHEPSDVADQGGILRAAVSAAMAAAFDLAVAYSPNGCSAAMPPS